MKKSNKTNQSNSINEIRAYIREQVEEYVARMAIRKLVQKSLTEAKEEEYKDLISITDAVFDFFEKNKKTIQLNSLFYV